MSKKKNVILKTTRGDVEVEVTTTARAQVTVRVYWAPVGPGLFVVFPFKQKDKALEAAKKLIEAGLPDEDANIAHIVPGALAAGTVRRPKFNVQFGIPKVEHAMGSAA